MNKSDFFDLPIVGKNFLKKRIVNKEGGEKTSSTLREYAKKKYSVTVGLYSYGSCFSHNFNIGGIAVLIGRYCSFASNITYYGANHPYEHASTSPYFYNKIFGFDNVICIFR